MQQHCDCKQLAERSVDLENQSECDHRRINIHLPTMTTEHVLEVVSGSSRSEIALRASETLSKNTVYVDEKFETVSSSLTVASQWVPPDVHPWRIYKPCEMGRKVVCLRYVLVTSFILLGISGAVVCGTGSYFLHQLRGSLTRPDWYGPPAILLTTGIINVILGPYFWHYFDTKYNQPQLFMFLMSVILVATSQVGAGIWSLVSHAAVDSSISEMLHDKLASVGTTNDRTMWNVTEIKVNCCGYDNSSKEIDGNDKITWSCCNMKRYSVDFQEIDLCAVFYTNECRHLALHRYRSILFHTFVLALCAFIIQIHMMICIRSYLRALMRSLKTRRVRSIVTQSTVSQQPQKTCPAVNLGPQHVCEGCSNARYH